MDNLATCVDTNGASFIVDGRKLKSINQWFNKENARLQSIKDRQKIEKLTLVRLVCISIVATKSGIT
ncbi:MULTISPECIES: transposase [unclassified Microcoleus]|uniref:transposase n=1 Tax=unclassified Microcoleus TaxID=2642155 RepID=UPI002FD45DF4